MTRCVTLCVYVCVCLSCPQGLQSRVDEAQAAYDKLVSLQQEAETEALAKAQAATNAVMDLERLKMSAAEAVEDARAKVRMCSVCVCCVCVSRWSAR